MKRVSGFLLLLLVVFGSTNAKAPINHMTKYTLGIEYMAALRGQLITRAEVNAFERMHLLKLHYSPFQFAQLHFGIGLDKFEVDYEAAERHFDGRYGFSPLAGLSLNSPALVRSILRITANLDALYLNSKDSKGYKYSGPIIEPSIGLIAHAGQLVDFEAGMLGHFIVGEMTNPSNQQYAFSNVQNLRGYFNFTLCSPTGAFAQVHIDASPDMNNDFDNGPVEATIGISLGILITPDMTNEKLLKRNDNYFPEFKKLKKKEEKLQEDMHK